MKKSVAVLSAAILFGTGLYTTATPAFAERPAQIQQKIDENRKEQAKVEEQIAKIEQAIKENEKVIATTENVITITQEEIKQLNDEKVAIEKKMEARNELIKERLRLMQQNGGNKGYLEIIFGSANFTELIGRTNAVSKIIEADQNLIEEQKKDAELLAKKEQEAQEKLTTLNEKKAELEGMLATISEQKREAEELKRQLENEEYDLIRQKEEAEAAERSAIEAQLSRSLSDSKSTTNKIQDSTSTPSASASDAIGIVTTVGMKYIGNSTYVWGAQDPANGYFDCSGFVNWAFKQAGYSIGRSTSALSGQGTKVSVNDMRPGDLVFFDTYKKNGHVGIYLGNGKFIGSQNGGVGIADMTSGYWANTFKGHVRRVIN